MRQFLNIALSLFAVALLILPTSCRHTAKVAVNKVDVKDVISLSRQRLASGDLQGALDIYKAAHAKNSENKTLLESYVKTIEEVKTSADKSFNDNNPVNGGMMYGLLLKNYPHFKGFFQMLSFTRESLTTRIANCSASIYKKGLEQYRNGNLENAISVWKNAAAFDPGNPDIKKAIDTTSIQLKSLQDTK